MQSDVRVVKAEPWFTEVIARTPLKFGAVVMDAVTYCEVKVTVETQGGAVADGWGGIFLADFWAFPSALVPHEARERAMREITTRFCQAVTWHGGYAHPVDLFHETEQELRAITDGVSRRLNFAEPMPYLGALVCASPVDAALHDAFGIANQIGTYDGYGREFMPYDLGRYLGEAYQGRYIADFIRKQYAPQLPIFHLVGGLDKLRRSEKDDSDPQDGLPVSLDEWVERDSLICLKVKLRGTDLEWDVQRTIEVAKIGREVQARQGKDELYLSADTNEQCDSPDYVIEMLQRIRERDPRTFDQILYIEQPTERDLSARRFDMRPLAKIKPVLVDESLTGLKDFELAMELGWSGIALKSCKCQSAELVLASKAEAEGVPYAIQDLTNPALALIHSVGMAARLNPIKGVEANSRQFFPAASERERRVHPDIFTLRQGMVSTLSLQGYGLGYRMEEMGPRF